MGYVDSPPDSPSSSFREAAFNRLKVLILRALRRSQEFFDSKKLPYVANQVCQVYFGKSDPQYLSSCRRILRSRVELNPKQLQYFLQTGLGGYLLQWLAPFFHLSDDAIAEVLLQLAADPDGLSLLSILRYGPNALQVNVDHLLMTTNRVRLLLEVTEKAIATIGELAEAEAILDAVVDASVLSALQQPGPWAVQAYDLVVERGSRGTMRVICYQPQDCDNSSIPVVIQSHGLASNPEDLAEYAHHLASHGYFVAAPQHPGSDSVYAREMLAGRSPEVFEQAEFIHRPHDISALLDELEQRNKSQFGDRLNLTSVGVLGYSFGAYTTFALAGAELHFEALENTCHIHVRHPHNPSLLLQCQALRLPRHIYNLRDPRVQAILAMEPLGSEMFGAEGMAHIQIPVLFIAGSHDAVTPLVLEQARLFQWLTAPHRYLALMQGKSHLRDLQRLVQQLELHIKLLPPTLPLATTQEPTPFDTYTNVLSLAFFNQHLHSGVPLTPTLSATFAAALSQPPLGLSLISDRSSSQLQTLLQELNETLTAITTAPNSPPS
ncbi:MULTISPECIES: alpha/beta hydrolase [unclassified Leptolyngbya]|uniref:alpha/beta hydrolase n=1 Tax=unclassified Leptolyngbya TaxID=2650499 RepID=UPI001683D2EF|nr:MULTISPECIES: alpha/beta hydrolase [unclassified Leptolyngbya]MBD1910493.1 alpha/beta hydrolase [Leptolyngbya sp. FACHB-8]MBD2153660.1 alpha/beta hydrolase [Leptolyngbya sp. FACHB-16]